MAKSILFIRDFSELISRAGLKIDQMFEGLGTGHTLLVCKKAYI